MEQDTPQPDSRLSDDELATRTADLIRAAENISFELVLQTERLANTIDTFNREIVQPLKRGSSESK